MANAAWKKETVSSVLIRLSELKTDMCLGINENNAALQQLSVQELWQNVQDVLVTGKLIHSSPLFIKEKPSSGSDLESESEPVAKEGQQERKRPAKELVASRAPNKQRRQAMVVKK
jgi:hypothetical protein